MSELDALRGIAVLLVVVFHFSMPEIREHPSFYTRFGITGVDLFFMISGFVIFMSLERVSSGREFLINRFARLYPTYWWCVSLLMAVSCCNAVLRGQSPWDKASWLQYLCNLTMFQNYFGIDHLDGPYWSLIVEVLFYLTILGFYKAGKLAYTEIALTAIVAGWGTIELMSVYHPYNATLKRLSSSIDLYYPLISYLPLFLMGVVFYKILKESFTWQRGLIILVCYTVQLSSYHRQGALPIFNVSQADFAVILLVFLGLFALVVNGQLKRLAVKPLLFFGKISYALYLFHQYFCLSFLIPLFEERLHIAHQISIILSFSIAVGVAWLNTVLIDEPFRKRVRKMLLPTKVLGEQIFSAKKIDV